MKIEENQYSESEEKAENESRKGKKMLFHKNQDTPGCVYNKKAKKDDFTDTTGNIESEKGRKKFQKTGKNLLQR